MAISKIHTSSVNFSVPSSYADLTGQPFTIKGNSTQNLWSGITHGNNNGNAYGFYYSDVDIASYVTANTIGLVCRVYYQHGGTSNHGYNGGYVIQKNETDVSANRGEWYYAHYDDYYNTDQHDFLVPWNSSGDTNIRLNITSSHNTNSSNTYAIKLVTTIEKAS